MLMKKKIQIYLSNDIKKNIKKNPKYSKYFSLPYILFVGKRYGYKNFDNLLKTFSENFNKLKDIFIICFGGNNFQSKKLIKLII